MILDERGRTAGNEVQWKNVREAQREVSEPSSVSTQQPPALVVSNVHVTYGAFVAVEEANLTVNEGDCIVMIGPNGNGKSTLAMAIAGLLQREGTVHVFGEVAPPGNAPWMVRHRVSLVPERRQLFPHLSVIDHITLGCYAWTRSLRAARTSHAFEEAVELFPELKPCHKQLAGTLSGGQQQMLALARGLSANPRVLIIDEPCLGLAEVVSQRVYAALKQLNNQGRTILLIEEKPWRALQISNGAVRVKRGVAEEITSAAELSMMAAGGGEQ